MNQSKPLHAGFLSDMTGDYNISKAINESIQTSPCRFPERPDVTFAIEWALKPDYLCLHAGFLSDMTGDYNISFYVAGTFLGLGGLICFPLRRIARWERSRDSADVEGNYTLQLTDKSN